MASHMPRSHVVDLGACDGMDDALIEYALTAASSWSTLLVEADPDNAAALRQKLESAGAAGAAGGAAGGADGRRRRDAGRISLVHGAAVPSAGGYCTVDEDGRRVLPLHRPERLATRAGLAKASAADAQQLSAGGGEGEPPWRKQIGSVLGPGNFTDVRWITTKVPCVTVEELIAMRPAHLSRTAIVKCDVEGLDVALIGAWLEKDAALLPLVVRFESWWLTLMANEQQKFEREAGRAGQAPTADGPAGVGVGPGAGGGGAAEERRKWREMQEKAAEGVGLLRRMSGLGYTLHAQVQDIVAVLDPEGEAEAEAGGEGGGIGGN